jgi:hypothetical protein
MKEFICLIFIFAIVIDGKELFQMNFIFIFLFILVSNPISCFVCDSKEDEHCPETWTRTDVLPVECGGPDGVQDARFCIKTIAVFGGLFISFDEQLETILLCLTRCCGNKTFL